MPLLVSTTGSSIIVPELGITIVHPTVDRDLSAQFPAEVIRAAESLTNLIRTGQLAWKRYVGDAVQLAASYDEDWLLAERLSDGLGANTGELLRIRNDDVLAEHYVPTWNPSLQRWEAHPTGGHSGGPGATAGCQFGRSPNTGAGSYFDTSGGVSSASTGVLLPGLNKAVKLTASNSGTLGAGGAVIRIQQLVAGVRVDVAGVEVTIPAGSKSGIATFPNGIALANNAEVSAYNVGPGGVQNAIIRLYIVPQ